MSLSTLTILACDNHRLSADSCGGRGASTLIRLLRAALAEQGMTVPIETLKCFGRCTQGPVLRIAPGQRFFSFAGPETIPAIIDELRRLNRVETP